MHVDCSSMSSSIPGLHDTHNRGLGSGTGIGAAGTGIGTGAGAGAGVGVGVGLGASASATTDETPTPCRPQLHPIQDLHQQPLLNEAQLRSFSTASALPMYMPSSSSTLPPSQSRNSITETLKEHRWSKGLKLNWMPGFSGTSHQVAGLERPLAVSSVSKMSSKSSSSQKSIQRRKSEGTGLRITRSDQDTGSAAAVSLGLAPVSISGKSFPRGIKSGIESSVDQLKVSEARTRRISDSGLSTTSSKLSAAGLAERISGFAQTVRGLSRTSFSAGHSTPSTSSSSSCSTPSTPGFTAQCSYDPRTPMDRSGYRVRQQSTQISNVDKEFDNWDDFLEEYRIGHFPGDCAPSKPLTASPPPTPGYVCGCPSQAPDFFPAPTPANEERRLRALYSFQILQTDADPNFERIVHLVATVMGVMACTITLVDHERVYMMAESNFEHTDFAREHSICGHTILRAPNDPLVVLDATKDWRFKNLPAVVSEPHIRFYAGAPLTTSDGLNIGSLCLFDVEPRSSFSDRERMLLVDFAAVVMREMELWNDQVQLCIRNRMMRDVTRWVRGCLDISMNDSITSLDDKGTGDDGPSNSTHPLDSASSLTAPFDIAEPSSSSLSTVVGTTDDTTSTDSLPAPALISPPLEPVFPTPSGSPTLLSCALRPASAKPTSSATSAISTSGNPLQDRAFPAACVLIQATLNVDAVYLVQAANDQSVIPPSGSSIVWNYLEAAGRRKGSVGVVSGGRTLDGQPNTAVLCLASSKKSPETYKRPVLDEKVQQAKRQGDAWVCTEEGCRPHRLGDSLLHAVEPAWERDVPIIKEMLGYVRQEIPVPSNSDNILFTCSTGKDVIESDYYETATPGIGPLKDPSRRKLLCHTFQGTVPSLVAGSGTPYQSCVIVPILGPPMASALQPSTDDQPWAYFVILSASRTKQFSFHERIYLKNFGSCLITEVLKRRVEAADKAKGVFIKSISHELRTPLHIILGILELLYANPEEPLSENQMAMVASAEASGKSLIDTINNIIDLAKLDPENSISSQSDDGESDPAPHLGGSMLQEIDIRELCEQVAGTMAKACADKNLVVLPSWTKPSLAPLSTSVPSSAPVSASSIHSVRSNPVQCNSRGIPSPDESVNGYTSSTDSQNGFTGRRFQADRKAVLELMVAMDEPDRDPDRDIHWSFKLNVPVMTRILTQLVENAIKFTSSGFVELSAVSPPLGSIPLKPPHPDARPILFTVRDTGKGISSEFVQSYLFQRFSQEDPLQVGTGLGLALVKLLVENLGGWLEIWSEGIEGKGCVVKVLIWATPASRPTKSLKDMSGAWLDKSCRFYTGESSVGSDRLWKIMGERMIGQQLNMNFERGDEHDASVDDMLKNLSDQSPCDLLILNDDLVRLRAYLYYWGDHHEAATEEPDDASQELVTPTPLLMLTSPNNVKNVRKLVDDYLVQVEATSVERPATIVIMTKPIGPLKLTQCLRDCFIPAVSNRGLQTPQGSPRLVAIRPSTLPLPMIRSATVPHITTTSLGTLETGLLSAGNIIRSRFIFPTNGGEGDLTQPMVLIPPHSPGGLVIPPRILSVDPSPATTPERESCPTQPSSSSSVEDLMQSALPATEDDPSSNSLDSGTRPRPQRSIRNFMSQRQLRNGSGSDNSRGAGVASSSSVALSPLPLPLNNSSPNTNNKNNSDCCLDKTLPRVLIVEDNITNRMILRTFLKKRGIGVVEAENGKIGVERFQEEVHRRQGKQGFEFVLMDLQMPIMDGNMATKQIREFEQSLVKEQGLLSPPKEYTSETTTATSSSSSSLSTATSTAPVEPFTGDRHVQFVSPCSVAATAASAGHGYRPTIIFALTGLAADEDKRLAFECGVDGYLTKPVSLKTLGSLLSSCLPGNMEGKARAIDLPPPVEQP
ncbi:His Kinase A domain containing protein [Podila humilis]|nr:His Kinase A domain containing protein [Podila humilis]